MQHLITKTTYRSLNSFQILAQTNNQAKAKEILSKTQNIASPAKLEREINSQSARHKFGRPFSNLEHEILNQTSLSASDLYSLSQKNLITENVMRNLSKESCLQIDGLSLGHQLEFYDFCNQKYSIENNLEKNLAEKIKFLELESRKLELEIQQAGLKLQKMDSGVDLQEQNPESISDSQPEISPKVQIKVKKAKPEPANIIINKQTDRPKKNRPSRAAIDQPAPEINKRQPKPDEEFNIDKILKGMASTLENLESDSKKETSKLDSDIDIAHNNHGILVSGLDLKVYTLPKLYEMFETFGPVKKIHLDSLATRKLKIKDSNFAVIFYEKLEHANMAMLALKSKTHQFHKQHNSKNQLHVRKYHRSADMKNYTEDQKLKRQLRQDQKNLNEMELDASAEYAGKNNYKFLLERMQKKFTKINPSKLVNFKGELWNIETLVGENFHVKLEYPDLDRSSSVLNQKYLDAKRTYTHFILTPQDEKFYYRVPLSFYGVSDTWGTEDILKYMKKYGFQSGEFMVQDDNRTTYTTLLDPGFFGLNPYYEYIQNPCNCVLDIDDFKSVRDTSMAHATSHVMDDKIYLRNKKDNLKYADGYMKEGFRNMFCVMVGGNEQHLLRLLRED